MTKHSELPSYAELFGKLDFKQGDEARSVYSPAAYLVDLLQLLNDKFDKSIVVDAERRPDIPHILLNAENTFTEVPYLDIVNKVLEIAISKKLSGLEKSSASHILSDPEKEIYENLGAVISPFNMLSDLEKALYDALKEAKYSFQMPFDLDNEKVKKYLHYLEVNAVQLYKNFALQPDFNIVAREHLGLSQTEDRDITTPSSAEACYNLSSSQGWEQLASIESFLKTTGLTGKALRELLFQNLNESATDSEGRSERTQAAAFFINDQLGGYVTLDSQEEKLVWSDSSVAIPEAWFERVHRFVQLANKSDISFSDLDLILRSCCHNKLDANAIRTIAVIKYLCDMYELPVDVACSFFSPISILGIGDAKTPQDLFNRTFNTKFTDIDKKYIAGSRFIPVAYTQYTRLECVGDVLSLNNKEYRRRLSSALGLSDTDLTYIITRFRTKYPTDLNATILSTKAEIGVSALSVLYRIIKLAEMLDISYPELFGLLDLLEQDPSIRTYNNFDLLIGEEVKTAEVKTSDCYRILEKPVLPDALWLVQMLFALAKWMQANDFTSEELNQILSGRYPSAAATANHSQKITVLDNLYQQFKPVMLAPDQFVSDRFNVRAAHVIHRVLIEQGDGLVSEHDRRLVRFDDALAAPMAYQTLDQLAVITKEDFQGLGLEQKLLEKIYANLILKEYLNTEGVIIESRLPKQAIDFVLTTDFHPYTEEVFGLIHDLYNQAVQERVTNDDDTIDDDDLADEDITDDDTIDDTDDEDITDNDTIDDTDDEDITDDDTIDDTDDEDITDDDTIDDTDNDTIDDGTTANDKYITDDDLIDSDPIELSFFTSDLDALEGLSEDQRDELYDNLIFNGYIDAEGNVLQADFFALPENAADLELNVDLSKVASGVFTAIMQQVKRFDAAPLKLDTDIFANLRLTSTDIDDLVENLQFNDYIDQAHLIINKRGLLAMPVEQFNVALAFYPQRRNILSAIQSFIDTFKIDVYTIPRESLRGIADVAVAQQVMERLEKNYLNNNRVSEYQKAFFLDPDHLADFVLGDDVSASEHAQIFAQIAAILTDAQKYQLPLSALEELNFDDDETNELLGTLEASEDITQTLLLPEDKIDYFLNINNALDFRIDRFTDYNKDIFFILHNLAKESAAARNEIVAAIKTQADSQVQVVFDVLQDALGAEADLIKVVCDYMLDGLDQVVEAFMLPVLAIVGINDTISTEPDNSKFNLLYKRLFQFTVLANKLQLSPEETAIIWRDQDLVDKFPEKLTLPVGIDDFDALLEDPDGVIYLFKDKQYWAYSAKSYTLLKTPDHQLTSLSDRFAEVTKIDAAFVDSNGTAHIVAREDVTPSSADTNMSHTVTRSVYFNKQKGSKRWVKQARNWGQIKSNFADPVKIDTAFQDHEGKIYLFAGSQYIRYSGTDYAFVDEGYPLTISGNWEKEGLNAQLPSQFKESIDASFQGTDGKTYLFKNNQFVSSDAISDALDIKSKWGKVRNTFEGLKRLDAAFNYGAEYYFFAGDQVIVYQDSIENDQVSVIKGYPKRIETFFGNLPAEFESGLEAAFVDSNDQIHLFKDGKTIAWKLSHGEITPLSPNDPTPQTVPVKERWGVVTNKILQTGKVDAAFVGLDGKTYLFSADQYVRYSGGDYTQVDEGYPRMIAKDWAGLQTVDAAFALDGKTYLFGADIQGQTLYVRYSKKDYSAHDEGYPKAPNDNWWNLPVALVQEGAPFERIDAIFCGKDNRTYLFSDNQFIVFDNKHRWWSEPQQLSTYWDSIPFNNVDAAFVGKDGKTYIFSGKHYIRYSNSTYTKIDDRYPNNINTYWGNVVNNIAKSGKVDAALTLDSYEVINEVKHAITHTYLFAGNQYFRYVGDQFTNVENGYPKYIATSLKTEPRFTQLTASFENGIDAAFADRHNVYLFSGGQCHVVSDSIYTVYATGLINPSCAFLEDGALLIEEDGVWNHYKALEGIWQHDVAPKDKTIISFIVAPATLRGVPTTYQQDLNAVLKGVDKNTYLFKGPNCFNVLLNKEYPLAEEWGRAKNNIYLHNTIDAAFVGHDNKTYLFSGEQFYAYSSQNYSDTDIDAYPQSIVEHWGGLTTVALAFVKDEKTFLFEKADASGNFRYVCYSTTDYSHPDAGFPQIANMDFWEIPASYQAQGFDTVNAVLFDEHNMFLISHDQFLQYSDTTDLWSYPRPLNRIWRDMPLDKLTFPGVKTAFVGADGATYFFSEETYLRYSDQTFTRPASIKDNWGLTHNNFIHNHNGNQVDAAFVYQNKITYLFSGDQYVRYSGQDYRYVDAGYPKPLVGNLRQEQGFQNLPPEFEDVLLDRIANPERPVINAVVANNRNLYLLIGGKCYAVSQSVTATYDIGIIGHVKNHLVDQNHVDASFVGDGVNGTQPTYLFCSDQYVRYTTDDYTYVDDGYPRTIADAFASEMGVPALPAAFNEGLDAALRGTDGHFYLFKDKHYIQVGDPTPRVVRDTWGHMLNRFDPLVRDESGHVFSRFNGDDLIDASFIAPNGGLYLFKGDQYIRYQSPEQKYVDEGYPKVIKDNWGDLPVEFEHSIDGAFVFDGKTYLVSGDDYVRYSDASYLAIDSMYPQAFKYRWGAWADYLLSDVKTIARFKELQDAHAAADDSLVTFLNPPPGVVKTPFELLAAIFGWDLEEIKWLKRHNGFLGTDTLFEKQFQLELVIKFADIFAMAQKMGAAPSDLFDNVWQKLYATNEPTLAAEALYRYLAQNQSEQDWQTLSKQIHNELNLIKRDVLVPLAIASLEIENTRALYEYLLIDPEMGSSGVTSYVQEAIAAIQLYVHRYFVNQESPEAREGTEQAIRQKLKNWWKWMKNYRVWEANRKVFLYPENYIRPELRDTKTPAFKTLEDDLQQGEITAELVERAYKKYLDEYTEVSRLTIAGGYVYPTPEEDRVSRRLVLFGRTKTDPRRYYYRTAKFLCSDESLGDKPDSVQWDSWSSVNVQIDADKVYPIFAFGRVFVFWTKTEAVVKTTTTTDLKATNNSDQQTASLSTLKSGDQQTTSSATTYEVKIFFSFYNLNKEWVPAQTLTTDIVSIYPFLDVKLFVENSISQGQSVADVTNNQFGYERILISCNYTLNAPTEVPAVPGPSNVLIQIPANSPISDTPSGTTATPRAFSLSPELYVEQAPPHSFIDEGQALFNQIVDEPSFINAQRNQNPFSHSVQSFFNHSGKVPATINQADVVMFNKLEQSSDRWFSFDYKGASFLCKPVEQSLGNDTSLKKLASSNDINLPRWKHIDAAFAEDQQGYTGKTYFFNNDGFIDGPAEESMQPTKGRWGKVRTTIAETGKVDTGIALGGKTYLFSGDQYLTFSNTALSDRTPPLADKDYPKRLSDNSDCLPRWTEVSAAFNGLDGKAYFFNNQTHQFVTRGGDGQISLPHDIKGTWGRIPLNSTTSNPTAEYSVVDGAFVRDNYTYLFSGEYYVRYTGHTYERIDDGYPKVIKSNTEQLPNWKQVSAVFTDHNGRTYFFDDQTYVEASNLNKEPSPGSDWGIIHTNLTASGHVDAAYVHDGLLYLTSGDQFVRYSLIDGKTPDAFVDAGYPKTIDIYRFNIDKIDAAFTRIDSALTQFDPASTPMTHLYLFVGASYFKIPANQEIDKLVEPQLIKGKWADLPPVFEDGIDGAFQHGDTLYLFKELFLFKELSWFPEMSYAKYTDKSAPREIINGLYNIIRLTTSTAYKLNQKLFAGGVAALLSLDTQQTPELPAFIKKKPGQEESIEAAPNTIVVSDKVKFTPSMTGSTQAGFTEETELDFDSANGIYYWEIFFHIPFLIAQTLNTSQKFEEAKEWYEYIFDPTASPQQKVSVSTPPAQQGSSASTPLPLYWRFSPFYHSQTTNEDKKSQAAENKNDLAQIDAYLNDPFDPHAIAMWRHSAYRKAIVMAYVDNLLDWGDMLFRQYTRESIDEARMLYILAYDLLGEKPENLGTKILFPPTDYLQVFYDSKGYEATLDDLLDEKPENLDTKLLSMETGNDGKEEDKIVVLLGAKIVNDDILTLLPNTPHESVGNPYFFVPENSQFGDYWTRVEDRLYKIRQSLNILGISQPLPLFEPPIDPMALVQAVSSGAALSSALASLNISVPHYRFSFMLGKAQELAQKLTQLGSDLLMVLEKKDAEELSLLLNRQEAVILNMTTSMKTAQVEVAAITVKELEASLYSAQQRVDHYQGLITGDFLPAELAQISLMSAATSLYATATVLKIASAITYMIPEELVGPFIMGTATGGDHFGNVLSKHADAIDGTGQALNMGGEIAGIFANHQRTVQEWTLQKALADSDVTQINHQLDGARIQAQIAQYELDIHNQEIAHNAALKTFMQGKYSTVQLYQWMISKLGGLYYQTYSMAYDIAKAAEKAFQYERGLVESAVQYIQPLYWDSQKQGLLAGYSLGLDLDRMEKAFIESNSRGFEITKQISLLALDPVALLQLKSKGVCEFSLSEELFDYDFPGHYCRQVKTVSLSFTAGQDQSLPVNATLTQLSHKTVLEPDLKAVRYLLSPKDQPPQTLRSNWRASQQIVLSQVAQGEENNGMFSQFYLSDDRYLPFEGTGAVSTWRLELNGRKGSYDVNTLQDVVVMLKYTAEQGGSVFGTAVKGMLKPYPNARYFDVATEFADQWQAFKENNDNKLTLTFSRDLFPDMSGGKINGIFARYELSEPGDVSFVLNGDKNMTLRDGKFLSTTGLSVSSKGAEWVFTTNGEKAIINNIGLVLSYKANVI